MPISDEKTTSAPTGKPLAQLLLGSGVGVGAIVAYYLYQTLTARPAESFGLLRAWGPWWVLAVMACFYSYNLLKLGVDYVGKLASAVEQIAAKDDRQFEEMQRMTQFSGRQTEHMVELLLKQGEDVKEIAIRIQSLPCKTRECKS